MPNCPLTATRHCLRLDDDDTWQVLLYGGDGGFAIKLRSMTAVTSKVVQIQAMFASYALVRRVRRRRAARLLVAAVYIQKLYKRRMSYLLSDHANRLANVAAQHRKDFLAEREARAQAEMKEREAARRRERRGGVLRRRWVAVRSAVAELKLQNAAATMLQCRWRTKIARRKYQHASMNKRSRVRELQPEQVTPAAEMIQARVRAHRAATRLLMGHFAERVSWYNDSRNSMMLAPLAKHVSLKRRELQMTLKELKPSLEALPEEEKSQLGVLQRLWAVQVAQAPSPRSPSPSQSPPPPHG